MADVSGTLPSWSVTRASNNPQGNQVIGTGLDDNLREIQGVTRAWLASKGADIVSATTTDIGAVEGLFHDITGTTTITSFGTVDAGIWKVLKFEGALTLTHNATSLILLTGSNRTTAVGDVGMYISEGSGNWRELFYGNVSASGASLPFIDTNPIVVGSVDGTKKVRLEVDGLTTGTTRVVTVPDKDFTLNSWDFISGGTASNSATLDFTGLAGYFAVVFVLIDILPATDNAILNMRLSSNNGSSYDSGANYISSISNYQSNAASPTWALAGGGGATSMALTAGIDNASARCVGTIWLYPGGAFSQIIGNTSYIANDGASKFFNITQGDWSGIANAARFLMSSGNITSGTIKAYGLRSA